MTGPDLPISSRMSEQEIGRKTSPLWPQLARTILKRAGWRGNLRTYGRFTYSKPVLAARGIYELSIDI